MKENKKLIVQIVLSMLGVVIGEVGVAKLNQFVVPEIPLVPRMAFMIVTYFMIAVVPFWLAYFYQDKWSEFGFTKEKIGYQILIGMVIAFCMSLVFTVSFHLVGKSDWVNNGHTYEYLWQYIYDFIYFTVAVGVVEEFVFRGYIYSKMEKLFGSSLWAIVGSSVLFGLFHFMGGNIGQVFFTAVLGVIISTCKVKIKNCTLLSVIIAHGVYDALITVWGNVF